MILSDKKSSKKPENDKSDLYQNANPYNQNRELSVVWIYQRKGKDKGQNDFYVKNYKI